MAAVAESAAIVSEQAKKEEKTRKREAKIKALEEEKRRKKEEEDRQKREREFQAIANIRNNGQNNKQAPRMPVNPAGAALAKPQPLAPKDPVKAAPQTPLPVVAPAKTTVPTSTAHVTSVNPAPVAWAKVYTTNASKTPISQSVAPAKATVPSLPFASGKSLNGASNINQSQQQPAAHATHSTEVTFLVGQISINPSAIMNASKANILFGRKETQATTVLKTQTNGPPKAVAPQANQPAKEKVVPATKTTNGQKGPVKPYYSGTRKYNGPDQKINGNGRVTNGGGNGSGQRYNGNCYGQRYNGNGRFTNVTQKKQAKPEPIIDEEGFQLVVNRRR